MLICVSPNRALDRRLRLVESTRERAERAERAGRPPSRSARPLAGSKAARVAMAARALGEEATWVGFLSGAAGDEVEQGLAELRIPTMVVRTSTGTQSDLEVVEIDGISDGELTAGEVERFLSMCRDVFAEWGADAQVALSGSLPPGAPVDLYAQLTRIAHASGCRVLLDTSGEPLRRGLEAAPDLVKADLDEAGWLTGGDPRDERAAALRLFEAGARSVAVTLGDRGLYWQRDARSAPLSARPPRVDARSTVGRDDATLAGLAIALRRGLSDEETVALAVACGTASCLADAPGMIDPAEVQRLAGLTRAGAPSAGCAEGGR
jgi:1-phosphofructokinase family hexose kinase